MPETLRIHGNLDVPVEQVARLCGRWGVAELALFGSVLRRDFGPGSDVDVLVSFAGDEMWSLWDLIDMRDELGKLLGRKVDLVEKEAIRNPFRRREILSTCEVIYGR